mmetsp:Transcript_39215/g.82008  ORF Transcript_39215/g.82008 Transcript_39215/m.82008 type:complete len:439 (-) Transcript_39215:228-1544(-)
MAHSLTMGQSLGTSISLICCLSVVSIVSWGVLLRFSLLSQLNHKNQQLITSSTATTSLSSNPKYEYEVVTTNYGWDTPSGGTNFSRRILTGEFYNATRAHKHYNASAWSDLTIHPDPTRRIIAFMDIDTCLELNYPHYGGRDWWKNLEKGVVGEKFHDIVGNSCKYLHHAVTSQALLANPKSRLILLDCSGAKRFYLQHVCSENGYPAIFQHDQLIVAYMSVEKSTTRRETRTNVDVGLPPPAIKPASLNKLDRYAIQFCHKRTYLFSFQGRTGTRHLAKREKLLELTGYDDCYIQLLDQRVYIQDIKKEKDANANSLVKDLNNYKGIMEESVFVGAPRGDNLFSYRFAEILSAGAVPVVYADEWLPPFNEQVINWTQCAVFIPESEMTKTREILLAIPENVRCKMQQCAIDVWDTYISSRDGWVRGLVDVALSSSGV